MLDSLVMIALRHGCGRISVDEKAYFKDSM